MITTNRILSLISNKFLELIILPTEQCNFRCIYCYEDFTIGRMKRPTIDAIKNLIFLRAADLDVLKISWFGGEPLVAKNIIFEISEHIQKLRQKHLSLNYMSGITTNAFLLKEPLLTQLVNLGVTQYQVSLDGTRDLHDQTRKRLNGLGTFDVIWENLLAAKQTNLNFSMTLRIHLTPANIADIFQLVEQIKMNFSDDLRFSILFKAVENLGGPHQGSFKVLCGLDKKEIIQQLYHYVGTKITYKKMNNNDYICYAAQTNSFVIRANGKLSKCTVAFNDDRNALGQLLNDGTLEINPNKLALWTRGIKTQNPSDLSCPMSSMPKLSRKLSSIPVIVKS